MVVGISFLLAACNGDGADDSRPPDSGTDTGTEVPRDPTACADGAATRIVGADANGIGHAVEIVGDADGDGTRDLWVAGQLGSLACFVPGAATGDVLVDRCWTGEPNDFAGSALALVPDGGGTGQDVLAIGAIGAAGNTGAVYVVPELLDAPATLDGAIAVYTGEALVDYAGIAVADAGDMTGDGIGDLLVGATGSDASGSEEGRAYLVAGPITGGTHALADSPTIWGGGATEPPPPHAVDPTIAGDGLGWALSGGADFDGDGLAEVALGAVANDIGFENGGAVAVYTAPLPVATLTFTDADVLVVGDETQMWLGDQVELVRDADGDGLADLLVSGAMHLEGSVWLFPGTAQRGVVEVADARTTLVGDDLYDQAGYAMAMGDRNLDGAPDLVVGAPFHDGRGVIYEVQGPIPTGTNALADVAATTWEADGRNEQVGSALTLADVDGDGGSDLLYGAPFNNANGLYAGSGCLVLGP